MNSTQSRKRLHEAISRGALLPSELPHLTALLASERELRRENAAMRKALFIINNRPPVWTKSIPSIDGWYWCRMHSLEFVTEVRIENGQARSYCKYHDGFLLVGTTAEWAGPIKKGRVSL